MPSVNAKFAKSIRTSLIANEGNILCGSDMSGLETRTKLHYIWDYDPDYVKEQLAEDFDPHIDLSVFSGAMSSEEEKFYKWYSKNR